VQIPPVWAYNPYLPEFLRRENRGTSGLSPGFRGFPALWRPACRR
jgi:hypothetical protein